MLSVLLCCIVATNCLAKQVLSISLLVAIQCHVSFTCGMIFGLLSTAASTELWLRDCQSLRMKGCSQNKAGFCFTWHGGYAASYSQRVCLMYVYANQILTPIVFRLCRLLELENQFNIVMAEMSTVKERAFGLEGWKQQVDDASTQVASVLGHLNTGVEDIRYICLSVWQYLCMSCCC